MLAARNLSELELGLVANLSVETADEARKLVPTLEVRRWGRRQGPAPAGMGASLGACACTGRPAQGAGPVGAILHPALYPSARRVMRARRPPAVLCIPT